MLHRCDTYSNKIYRLYGRFKSIIGLYTALSWGVSNCIFIQVFFYRMTPVKRIDDHTKTIVSIDTVHNRFDVTGTLGIYRLRTKNKQLSASFSIAFYN